MTWSRVHPEHHLIYWDGVFVAEIKQDTDKGWEVTYKDNLIMNLYFKDLRDARTFVKNKVISDYYEQELFELD